MELNALELMFNSGRGDGQSSDWLFISISWVRYVSLSQLRKSKQRSKKVARKSKQKQFEHSIPSILTRPLAQLACAASIEASSTAKSKKWFYFWQKKENVS